MVKILALLLGLAPCTAAQTFQICAWPRPCASEKSSGVEWDGVNAPSSLPVAASPSKKGDKTEVSLPYFTPLVEITANPNRYSSTNVKTYGKLVNPCGVRVSGCYFLQDIDQKNIFLPIAPWLPLEVVHVLPPNPKEPVSMAELVGKTLEISGRILATPVPQKETEPLYTFTVSDYRLLNSK
ncbi:MAG: hypothetical protein HY399_06965 [Elusimicrobia bacterium]|nr:hypothetical protein [Elusimicrobiota bacterium]